MIWDIKFCAELAWLKGSRKFRNFVPLYYFTASHVAFAKWPARYLLSSGSGQVE